MKMNLPNKLTVLRLILVPIFVVIMMVSNALWASAVGLALFIIASLTDMLDGKIARKHNLVTDFGKFMDPLADKFMVIGAMFVILYRSLSLYSDAKLFSNIFFWAFMIVGACLSMVALWLYALRDRLFVDSFVKSLCSLLFADGQKD